MEDTGLGSSNPGVYRLVVRLKTVSSERVDRKGSLSGDDTPMGSNLIVNFVRTTNFKSKEFYSTSTGGLFGEKQKHQQNRTRRTGCQDNQTDRGTTDQDTHKSDVFPKDHSR